jgi:hypothetical protein
MKLIRQGNCGFLREVDGDVPADSNLKSCRNAMKIVEIMNRNLQLCFWRINEILYHQRCLRMRGVLRSNCNAMNRLPCSDSGVHVVVKTDERQKNLHQASLDRSNEQLSRVSFGRSPRTRIR